MINRYMDFPEFYRHAVLKGGVVQIVSSPFPTDMTENPSAVIIKPVYMGICRTDIKDVQESSNGITKREMLFGHEFIGEIVYAGIQTGFAAGMHVILNPNITPDRSTGFAEYVFITGDRALLQKTLVEIEQELLDPLWMPEPLACIIHSVNTFLDLVVWEDFIGKTVAVIGAGKSGIMHALCVKYLDGNVRLYNRSNQRLEFIRTKELFPEQELSLLANVENDFGKFDAVIAVPTLITDDILQVCFQLLKTNGAIHIYGGTKTDDTFLDTDSNIDVIKRKEQKTLLQYQGKTITLTGAYGCNTEDFDDAIDLYDQMNEYFPMQKLVTQMISLAELPAMMKSLAANERDIPGKIIVLPGNS